MSVASNPSQDPGTKALLESLERVVMDLNDMENMIENFEEPGAESFFSKVNEYIGNLKEVEKKAPACDLQVPREALERIDDDLEQNPEVFAQELLSRCKDEFGQLNARVLGIKKVRQTVMEGWNAERGRNTEGSSAVAEENGIGVGVATGGNSTAEGFPRTAAVAMPKGVGGKAAPGNVI